MSDNLNAQTLGTLALPPAQTALRRALDLCQVLPREQANIIEVSLRPHAPTSSKVRAFHQLYGMPVETKYTELSPERLAMRVGLILEELGELLYGALGITMTAQFEHEMSPLAQEGVEAANRRLLGQAIAKTDRFDPVEAADAMGDMIYVIHGMALEIGIALDPVISEIHAANMTKIGSDGQPVRREDGKVLKGPYYIGPNISTVLASQMNIGMDSEEMKLIYKQGDGSEGITSGILLSR